jgi:hypothetical protein
MDQSRFAAERGPQTELLRESDAQAADEPVGGQIVEEYRRG